MGLHCKIEQDQNQDDRDTANPELWSAFRFFYGLLEVVLDHARLARRRRSLTSVRKSYKTMTV